jgi:hypothetical protein
MHEALRLLIWLRFKASLRQLYQGLRTPKGILIGILILMSLGFMVLPYLMSLSVPKSDHLSNVDRIEHFVPLALFGYTLLTLFTSLGTDSISFTEEEVENLFTAPFSRRQLLVYKLYAVFKSCLFSSIFLAMGTAMLVPNVLRSFIGGFFIIMFTVLFPMLMTLLAQIGSTQLFNRRRKLVGIVLLGIFVFVFAEVAKQALSTGFTLEQANEWLAGITNSTVGSILLAPFKVYSNIIFSRAFDLAFLGNVAIACLIKLAFVGLIFRLDANYLEVVERTSFKMAKIRKNIQSSGGMSWSSRKEYKTSLPMLPFLKGMGPVVWRQILVTFRLTKTLILLSLLLMALVGIPILIESKSKLESANTFPVIAFMGIGYMSLFFALSAPVGFRPDLHRMEVFKCLPLGNAMVALGQLLGSVIILVAIQFVLVGLFAAFTPKLLWIWGIAFAGILPINYLAMAITNTITLLFPVKTGSGPKDLTTLGQNVLSMFALLTALGIVMVTVFGSAGLCFFLTRNLLATVTLGVVLAVAFCVAASFALIHAYSRFDVSLHSPV